MHCESEYYKNCIGFRELKPGELAVVVEVTQHPSYFKPGRVIMMTEVNDRPMLILLGTEHTWSPWDNPPNYNWLSKSEGFLCQRLKAGDTITVKED